MVIYHKRICLDGKKDMPLEVSYVLLRFSEAKMHVILKFVLQALCLKQSKIYFTEVEKHTHGNQKSNCD